MKTKPDNVIAPAASLKRFVRRLRLFLRLVWREWEPRSCGIPDAYRVHYRLTVDDAWSIASSVWRKPNTKLRRSRPAETSANTESDL